MDTAARQRPLLNTTSAVSGAPGLSLGRRPNFSVLVVYRVVPAKLATRKSDGFVLIGKRSHRLAARAHNAFCSRHYMDLERRRISPVEFLATMCVRASETQSHFQPGRK